MEEHLGSEEALVANIDVNHISIDCFVHESLELVRLDDLSVLVRLFVILCELLVRVFAYITIPFFNLGSDLRGVSSLELLTSVLKCRESVLGDVPTGKWDVLDTTRDNVAIANWEDVSHTITRVDDGSCHLREVQVSHVCRAVWSSDLGVEGQGGLDSNEESLDVEGLKHDLCHLLPVLWSVHWWLSQDKSMIVRLASKILMDRLVPELLDSVPVADLSTLKKVADLVRSGLCKGLLSNIIIELWVEKAVFVDATWSLKQRKNN